MKTDLYTKIVLTIIAFALTVIVLKDINITKTANATPQSSMFSDNRVIDVNIVSVNGTRAYDGLNVNVKNKVDMNIPYNGLDVNVKNDVEVNWPYRIKVDVENYRDFK